MSLDLKPPLAGEFETLSEALAAAAREFGAREAYVDGALRLTFGEWVGQADALAGEYVARGIAPGDVVALMMPASIDFAVGYAAAVRCGAVVTALNTRLGPREVDAILGRCQPRLVVRDDELDLPATGTKAPVMARRELRDASHASRAVVSPQVGRATDPAVIVWTSGTTGLPKGAWFDHAALRAAVRTAGVITAPFDRRLSSTPFAHAGYMAKVWEQAAWGMTMVISPTPWSADDTVRLLDTERITVAGGVPTQWAKVVEHPALARADLSTLRMCVTATAPTPPELVERMTKRLGCPVVVRYAMTESPSITGTEPGDLPEVLFRTVGRPQAGVELELRGDAGEPVATGDVGRVHLRSTCAMRGYWCQPDLTGEVLSADGWLRTGDLGRFDDHGNLVLVGRADDMYLRGGYNVYPLEVENVLTEHPCVDQAAVVGVPTPVIGETGVAFVVSAAGAAPPTLDELRDWCRARLADYKAPDEVIFVDALPLTPMMKVDKARLAQQVSQARG